MRAFALQLRTGPLRWLLLVALVVDLVVLATWNTWAVGIWPQTGARAQVPAYFLSFLAVGLAAWTSGARRRHRLDEQVAAAAIGRTRAEAPRFLAVLAVPLVPYLVGQAAAFTLTARTFPPGVGLWAAYAALGVVSITLATSLGWLLGKYLASTVASLVAVLTWLVLTFTVLTEVGLFVISGPPHLAPSTPELVARAVAVGALALAALWAPPRRTEWFSPPLAQTVAAPALSIAVLAVVLATPGIIERPIPADPLCTQGRPQLCLWPEEAKYLPAIAPLQARIAALPEGFVVPERFNQYGLEQATYDYGGETITQREGDLVFIEGRTSGAALSVAARVLTETTADCDHDLLAADPTNARLYRWLHLRLADATSASVGATSVVPGEEDAARAAEDAYFSRTPAERDQWATEQLQQLQRNACGR